MFMGRTLLRAAGGSGLGEAGHVGYTDPQDDVEIAAVAKAATEGRAAGGAAAVYCGRAHVGHGIWAGRRADAATALLAGSAHGRAAHALAGGAGGPVAARFTAAAAALGVGLQALAAGGAAAGVPRRAHA